MGCPIIFATHFEGALERDWFDALRAAMPMERIVPFAKATPDERREADIAIVANPEPEAIASMTGLVWLQSIWAGVDRLVAQLDANAPPLARLFDPELSRIMAEAVLTLVHYLQRDLPAYRQQQTRREYRQRQYRPPGSMTVGLLGLGEIGAAAGERLRSSVST